MNDQKCYTTQSYWEEYYQRSSITKESIIKVCSSYDPIWDEFFSSCMHKPRTILEIGAYPGRYLAYLASKFDLRPTAIDFNSDRKKIELAMQAMGVQDYDVIQDDFLSITLDQQFDLVYSIGFIEHFENFNEVMDKHVQLVKPGGALLIMVPNKRFLRKWYDYLCDYDNLLVHNTKCMSKHVFQQFAKRNHLGIVNIGYCGGFSYNVHQSLNRWQSIIYRMTRLLFRKINPLIARYPNPFFSSTLFGVFQK